MDLGSSRVVQQVKDPAWLSLAWLETSGQVPSPARELPHEVHAAGTAKKKNGSFTITVHYSFHSLSILGLPPMCKMHMHTHTHTE